MKRILFIFLTLALLISDNLFAQRDNFLGEFYFGAGAVHLLQGLTFTFCSSDFEIDFRCIAANSFTEELRFDCGG